MKNKRRGYKLNPQLTRESQRITNPPRTPSNTKKRDEPCDTNFHPKSTQQKHYPYLDSNQDPFGRGFKPRMSTNFITRAEIVLFT